MIKKDKIILSIAIIISAVIVFVSGVFIGSKTKIFDNPKYKRDKYIVFYQSKNIGKSKKEMNDAEKKTLKTFIGLYEKCVRNHLNENDRKIVKSIEKEVLEMSKNNTKIKFRVSDLDAFKNNKDAKKTISKMRKCLKNVYKSLSKQEKKELRLSFSKLSIDSIISIFHGIR